MRTLHWKIALLAETEQHVLLECEIYEDLRVNLLFYCNQNIPDFNNRDNDNKFKLIMTIPKITRKVA